MKHMIRLYNMVRHTTVLGPGTRAAIWFQGCHRNCFGCMSQGSRPMDGGKLISVDRIVKEIESISDIEGVTVSGGEPFLQIDGLYELLCQLRERTSLSVIIYTGFKMNELREMRDRKVDRIISELSDIIIDGEYIDALNDGVGLRGSSNQQVHFITDRYIEQKGLYEEKKRNAEIFVSGGELLFIGIPEKETLDEWKKITLRFSGAVPES